MYKLIKNPKGNIIKDFNNLLGSRWKGIMINDVVAEYVENIERYLTGTVESLLDNTSDSLSNKILKIVKKISETIFIEPLKQKK